MFEYKQDPISGKFVLMEVNGRLWGSLALAVQSGVDFPRLMYDLFVQGQVRPVFTYKVPCFTRHTPRDVYWLQANLRAPSGRPDILKVGVCQLCKELGNVLRLREGYDLESLADPLPGWTAWAALIQQVWGDIREKLVQRRWCMRANFEARQTRRRLRSHKIDLRNVSSLLFICAGNINRSAVAEKRLATLARSVNFPLHVSSAGVAAVEGNRTSRVSQEVAASLGIDLSPHRARPLTQGSLASADLVVVMDARHLAKVAELSAAAVSKTVLLGCFDPSDHASEIADPDGEDRAFFHSTYVRIVRCVDELGRLLGLRDSCTADDPRRAAEPLMCAATT
jgi:protein-tyrosine-phosphatase